MDMIILQQELKDKFIQDIDFKSLSQKVECQNGIGYSKRFVIVFVRT